MTDRAVIRSTGRWSYFKEGFGGTHNPKVGWEIFRETNTGGCCMAGAHNDVGTFFRAARRWKFFYSATRPSSRRPLEHGPLSRPDTWAGQRQAHAEPRRPATTATRTSSRSRGTKRIASSPETVVFPAVDNVRTWNLAAPRLGVSDNVTGDGRTAIKANWGLYWANPGTTSSNPNGSGQKRYVWDDANGDLLWQPGEEGRLISSAGGVATTSLDPEQKDDYTYDMSAWLEREVVPNLGVRAGFVHRGRAPAPGHDQHQPALRRLQHRDERNRSGPRRPGRDGRRWPVDPAFNPAAAYVGLPDPEPRDQRPGRADVRHVGDRDEQAPEQSLVGVGILLVHVFPHLPDGVEHLSPEPE